MSNLLHGHVSLETAHITFLYPYGRGRCLRREWIETAVKGANKGMDRFVTQTTTPAFNAIYNDKIATEGDDAANAWALEAVTTGTPRQWNAPKPTTYGTLAIMVQDPMDDGTGRISTNYRMLHGIPGDKTIAAFLNDLDGTLDAREQARIDALRKVAREVEARYAERRNNPPKGNA